MKDESNRINLLMIASGDLWGGAEAVVYNLAKGLKNDSRVNLNLVLLNYGRLYQLCIDAGINTRVIDESKHGLIALACMLKKTAGEIKPQIIHSHRYKENILAAFAKGFAASPELVMSLHGISEVKKSLYAGAVSLIERFIMKRQVSKIVAVSNDLREHLVVSLGLPSEKVCCIHNGIEFGVAGPIAKENGGQLMIGSAGRFVPVKDYALLTEIAQLVCAKYPHVRFVLAGDGPEMADIKSRIDGYALGERFMLPGRLEDVGKFYASLDIYINTSMHEGIPVTVLEAMGYSLPVVAPAVGGLAEIIEDNRTGILVKDRDAASFASALERLIGSPDTIREMGENANQRVREEFSVGKMVESYCALYQDVLTHNKNI